MTLPVSWRSPDKDFQQLEIYEEKLLDTPLWELTEEDFLTVKECLEKCAEKANIFPYVERLCEIRELLNKVSGAWSAKMSNPERREQMKVRREGMFRWLDIPDRIYLKRLEINPE